MEKTEEELLVAAIHELKEANKQLDKPSIIERDLIRRNKAERILKELIKGQ